MTNTSGFQKPVTLLKARMRHSRVFAALMVIVVLFSGTQLSGDLLALKLMEWGGYALVVTGVFIRIYCSLYIGGRKNDELVADGPFSIVRNPLYVGSFIALAGIGLQSTSILILSALLLSFIIYYPFVIKREEGFLSQKFGASYQRYCEATPRLIPNFSLWRSDAEISCKPRHVMRTMMDGMVFFMPLPLFDLLREMQASGSMPVWWVLP